MNLKLETTWEKSFPPVAHSDSLPQTFYVEGVLVSSILLRDLTPQDTAEFKLTIKSTSREPTPYTLTVLWHYRSRADFVERFLYQSEWTRIEIPEHDSIVLPPDIQAIIVTLFFGGTQ